jgi:hypothetical protein
VIHPARHGAAVIGGGLAGLTVALILARHRRVTVFESSDRLGGRIASVRSQIDNRVVELGGCDIAPHHRMLRSMCARLGLPLKPVSLASEPSAYVSNGRVVTGPQARIITSELEAAGKHIARLAVAGPRHPQAPFRSVEAGLEQILSPDVMQFFSDLPEHRQSLAGLCDLVRAAGGTAFFAQAAQRIRGGTARLIDRLSRHPRVTIRLDTPARVLRTDHGKPIVIHGHDARSDEHYEMAFLAAPCRRTEPHRCRATRVILTASIRRPLTRPIQAVTDGPLRVIDLHPLGHNGLVHVELWVTERGGKPGATPDTHAAIDHAASILGELLGTILLEEAIHSAQTIPDPCIAYAGRQPPRTGSRHLTGRGIHELRPSGYLGYMEGAVRSARLACRRAHHGTGSHTLTQRETEHARRDDAQTSP